MNTTADVVIVGAGPGGSACAWALTQAGASVVLLDSGPLYQPEADFLTDTQHWELTHFPHKAPGPAKISFAPMQPLSSDWRDLRSWNQIRGLITRDSPYRIPALYHHVRGVGGSTLAFSGEAHRLNPHSMSMRSRYGVAADWPVTYQELAPYYHVAEKQMGVSGPGSGLLPAHSLSYASAKLGEGCRKLSWDWEPNRVAILSRPKHGRPPCNYCGQCGRGCPRRDKGSADLAFALPAQSTGRCEIRTRCHVQRLLGGEQDRVEALEYRDETGQLHRIKTRVVVLAAGAVQTPRLMLLSESSRSPDGLGNESGQVGRNFMETCFWVSGGLHPEPLDSYKGIPSDAICRDFSHPGEQDDFIGGFRLSPTTLEANFGGPAAYAQRLVPGWGKAHKEAMKSAFGHALSVGAVGESLPNSRSLVDLDHTQVDEYGDPLPRIHSYLTDNELRRLRAMAKRCRELLGASGIGSLSEEIGSYDIFNSTHVFGTCRMGDDPENNVVNRHGQSHRWVNLFIADASVFPSSGSGESPSLTIAALAIRQGKYIAARMAAKDG